MIEAPEARLIAEQLNHMINGKLITTVVPQFSPHKFAWFNGDHSSYEQQLTGREITSAHWFGGMVRIDADPYILLLTDGVNLSYVEPGGKLPAKHQLLLGFEDESALCVSVRMYGGIILGKPGTGFELSGYYDSARNKPQVMSDDFTYAYFAGLYDQAERANKTAKAFLATQQTVPGLGNGVLQDILYNARVNPKSKLEALDPEEKEQIFKSVRTTLDRMYAEGGRDTESDIFGRKGRYVSFLSKATVGKSCSRCGGQLVKENYLGGSIYYCTGCQPCKK